MHMKKWIDSNKDAKIEVGKLIARDEKGQYNDKKPIKETNSRKQILYSTVWNCDHLSWYLERDSMMLTFKLIKIVDDFYHYEIYPEGKTENKGLLVFNPETMEIKTRTNPEGGYDWISKAVNGLTDENGNYKESGMVAWYWKNNQKSAHKKVDFHCSSLHQGQDNEVEAINVSNCTRLKSVFLRTP